MDNIDISRYLECDLQTASIKMFALLTTRYDNLSDEDQVRIDEAVPWVVSGDKKAIEQIRAVLFPEEILDVHD